MLLNGLQPGCVSLDGLVEIGVEGHLLDVLLLAELDETLPGCITGVEDLLQQVKHQVSGSILGVPLPDVLHEVRLIDHANSILRALDDRLRTHATALGSEVDAFTRALGHIPGGISDEDRPVLDPPGPWVLGNRVGLHPDDLTPIDANSRSVSNALLVSLNALLVDDGASANGNMIALGEDPGVEVGRHIISDVHLGPVLVVFHLVLRDAHALLESDGILVVACLDVLCDAAVCPVSANDNIDFKRLLLALASIACLVSELVEGEDVRLVLLLRDGHAHEETVDQRGTVLLGPLSEEVIKNLAADHADELVILECLTDLDLLIGRRDHGHLFDLTNPQCPWEGRTRRSCRAGWRHRKACSCRAFAR